MPSKPENLKIRQAGPADARTVVEFIRALAVYESKQDEVHINLEEVDRILTQGQVEVLLAFQDHEPVGFALYYYLYSTFAGRPGLYLEDLFVLPDRRGQGIGRALLAAYARIGVEADCRWLEWKVLGWNTPSIEFYKSLGATPNDEWVTYRMDETAMRDLAKEDIL